MTPVELRRLRHDLVGGVTAEGAGPVAAQGVHLAVIEAFAYDTACFVLTSFFRDIWRYTIMWFTKWYCIQMYNIT